MARRPLKAKGRPKKRLPTTVTARSPKRDSVALVVRDPNGLVVPADGSLQLGSLGLVELKLTKAEEAALSAPVNPAEILWRPSKRDGPPDIPYLPHITYTRWFNRAFGRTGWNLVPIGKPTKSDTNVVLLPYVLHVHGTPIAFAWGEQEYFPSKADGASNRAQTYGDVIESTVGSALRRCAKHLGVGLELWDKTYLSGLRRSAPPSRPPSTPARTGSEDKISPKQRFRLSKIAERASRTPKEMREYLQQVYRVKSSRDLLQQDYAAVCAAVEARGPLPVAKEKARDPDEVLPPETPIREGDIGWGLK